jgi:glycosyltransferase involved in cell wall biosynthesis
MTSIYEGQPLTLFEAMASGLPCIVSDIPVLNIVGEAGCGTVVDFQNTEAAAQQITQYLKRDNAENSRNAREYAVNNLDWQIIAGKYLEEFEKLGQVQT